MDGWLVNNKATKLHMLETVVNKGTKNTRMKILLTPCLCFFSELLVVDASNLIIGDDDSSMVLECNNAIKRWVSEL